MSALEKYGVPGELHRIMAEDVCPGCGSMLLSTPDGKVCLTCQAAKSGNEQGEPAWDELRKQAQPAQPPVETVVEPLASVEEDNTAEPVPVLREKQALPAAPAMIATPEEALATFQASQKASRFHGVESGEHEPTFSPSGPASSDDTAPAELARARAHVGQLAVELSRLVPRLNLPEAEMAQLTNIAKRLEEQASAMWRKDGED